MRITVRCTDDMRDLKVAVGGAELEFGDMSLGEEVTVLIRGDDVTAIQSEPTDDEPVSEQVISKVAVSNSENDDLFSKLTALRRELASSQCVPPYVIFNDKTLREMTEVLPADTDTFSRISGVGDSKLSKYADIFLEVIAKHVSEVESI